MREQLLIGFEAARRRADADDRKGAVAVIGIVDRAFVVHFRHRNARLRIVGITQGKILLLQANAGSADNYFYSHAVSTGRKMGGSCCPNFYKDYLKKSRLGDTIFIFFPLISLNP